MYALLTQRFGVPGMPSVLSKRVHKYSDQVQSSSITHTGSCLSFDTLDQPILVCSSKHKAGNGRLVLSKGSDQSAWISVQL
jgi:hypothetical protein